MQNAALIDKVKTLATEERRIGVEVLELLLKIEQRKAYSDLGYDGLFSFCVKELRYSEGQAYRRIQAMRALRQHPELKERIQTGQLTMTTVSQVQTYLNEEKRNGSPPSPEKIKETFEKFLDQSAKDVERGILELKGGAHHPNWLSSSPPNCRSAGQEFSI